MLGTLDRFPKLMVAAHGAMLVSCCLAPVTAVLQGDVRAVLGLSDGPIYVPELTVPTGTQLSLPSVSAESLS